MNVFFWHWADLSCTSVFRLQADLARLSLEVEFDPEPKFRSDTDQGSVFGYYWPHLSIIGAPQAAP